MRSLFSGSGGGAVNPVQRLCIWCFLALCIVNLLFFAWFSDRTRDAAGDEIVQKAYIISRLLSESAAHSIVTKDFTSVKRAMAEALRDRHLLGITLQDSRGAILLENSSTNPIGARSLFETPVKSGGKDLGILTASFSLDEQNERVTARLTRTALVQATLFLPLSLALLVVWRRHRSPLPVRSSHQPVVPAPEPVTPPVPELSPPLHYLPLPLVKLLPWHPPEPGGEALCDSPVPLPVTPILEAEAVPSSAETWRPVYSVPPTQTTLPAGPLHVPVAGSSDGSTVFLRELPVIQEEAAAPVHGAVPAAITPVPTNNVPSTITIPWHRHHDHPLPLIGRAAAEGDVPLTRDLCGASRAIQDALALLSDDIRTRRSAAADFRRFHERMLQWHREAALTAGRADLLVTTCDGIIATVVAELRRQPFAIPDTDAGAVSVPAGGSADAWSPPALPQSADIIADVAADLRHRALPALHAAVGNGANVCRELETASSLLDHLQERSRALTRNSTSLFAMAGMVRSLAEKLHSTQKGEGDDLAQPVMLLMDRLAGVAERISAGISSLHSEVEQSVSLNRAALVEAQTVSHFCRSAGGAVEDAAIAAACGLDLLHASTALSIGDLAMDQDPDRALSSGAAGPQVPGPALSDEYPASLSVAGETLQLAGTLLRELHGGDRNGPPEHSAREPELPGDDALLAAERLMREVSEHLTRMLVYRTDMLGALHYPSSSPLPDHSREPGEGA